MDEVEALEASADFSGLSIFSALFGPDVGWILGKGVLLLILASSMYGVLLFLTRQTLIVASRKIEYDIRAEVYDKLQRLPQSFYAKNKTGDIYVRATEDISRVREYFGPGFMYGVNTITRAGIIITIMFMVNSELTLWALMPLPLLSIIAYWMSSFIHHRSNEIQEQYAVLAGRAQETFSSIRLIKAFAREAFEQGRFNEESEIYRKKKLRLDIVESIFHPTLNLLVGVSIALVLWKGGLLVMENTVTVGNIAEFIIYVLFLTWPIAALGYTLNLIQRSAASNIRIQKLMSEPEMPINQTGKQTDLSEMTIEFKNVGFTYPDSANYALRNVNLKIEPGTRVAIVGRTGSGKTTLLQLLTRSFDVSEGQILINGTDIREIPLHNLRKSIGYVPQETFLFSETIRNNIAFGKENATFNEVEDAARAAAVYDNILTFDKKFETVLGERGITLSGGQKQRTSIARSLIRNPGLLILDDSLSAIDTNTEQQIVGYIRNVLHKTNVIQISHRLLSVRDADFIYVLHDGEIAECGTHETLIAQNGRYASMYNKQQIEKELAEL